LYSEFDLFCTSGIRKSNFVKDNLITRLNQNIIEKEFKSVGDEF